MGTVIVIGGGLAGLSAATWLAREGWRVTVLERSSALGGRARTTVEQGFHLNFGPHAVYRKGAAAAAMAELGVPVIGRSPSPEGIAWFAGEEHELPVTAPTLVRSRLLTAHDKVVLGAALVGVAACDPARLAGVSVAQWLAAYPPRVAAVLEALVRVTSYANAPELMGADRACAQLRGGLGGVLYLDGGWQGLVDGLRSAAIHAGVEVRLGAAARKVTPGAPVTVWTDDGAAEADAVLLAVPPAVAQRLTGAPLVPGTEVRAACLDLALRRLPRPDALFGLGIDEPSYASVHTATARLAPAGGHVVHLARYLAPDEQVDRGTLEALADRFQPGWREEVVHARFLPSLNVTWLPGPQGAPAVHHDIGVFLAGDWVADQGWIADRAVASARAAARAIVEAGVGRRRLLSGT